jgi:transposase
MVSHYDPMAEPTLWAMPDALWDECRPLLPPEKAPGTPGRPSVPLRRVLDGILYVLRTGCQWKAVPRAFGSGSTCHRRFQQWAQNGTWERLWHEQLVWYDLEHGIGWEWQAADSATVPSPPRRRRDRARPHQSGQARHQTARSQRSARGAPGRGPERGQLPRYEARGGDARQHPRRAPASHAAAPAASVSGQGLRLPGDPAGRRSARLHRPHAAAGRGPVPATARGAAAGPALGD